MKRSRQHVRRSAVLPLLLLGAFRWEVAAAAQATTPVQAQSAAAPDYDVSTVKTNNTGSGSMGISIDDDLLRATNVLLDMLMEDAYDIRRDQILGLPHWATVNHYDITAKVVEMTKEQQKGLSKAQRQAMMQKLLKERFHVESHAETRTLPRLELVVAKEGIKFQEFKKPAENAPPPVPGKPDPARAGWMHTSNNELTANGVEMKGLVDFLSNQTHMPVTDKTGLNGRYNFNLRFQRAEEGPQSGLHDETLPTLYSALTEQLGLKLESAKGPVQVLVIDKIEQPEEN